MRLTSASIRAHRPRALTSAFMTALLAAVLLAGAGFAAADAGARAIAKPGKPTAKSPKGTIATTKPTFTWGKAARATSYELRVYKGSTLLLKKTGIKKRSWTSSKTLPKGIGLTWKVRGKNARGSGAWSKSVSFTIATPQPPPPSSAKAITAFDFEGLAPVVTGTIDETAHTIAATVPYGTDVTALVATFTTTGVSVKVGATPQVSAVTDNDFTGPVTYAVTAADASTQEYTVTVTVADAVIGQSYGGGKIAYMFQSDDPGYFSGQTHGLIAATADQSAGVAWSSIVATEIGDDAQGIVLGTGSTNTLAIFHQAGCTGGAAHICAQLVSGGRSDWYLPSKDELGKLYDNRAAIGGFFSTRFESYYWSSSEIGAGDSWGADFHDGQWYGYGKASTYRVRAVRSF